MAKTVLAEVRVADLPQMQRFIGAVALLLKALPDAEPLPLSVIDAADELRKALVALGGKDIGPPPGSDEDRIAGAMDEAQAHPGRIVTR